MNKTTMHQSEMSPHARDRAMLPSGGLKITDPTDKEKLFTIDEQLN